MVPLDDLYALFWQTIHFEDL